MKLEFKLKIKKLYTFILCGVLFVKNLIFKNSFVLERFLYTNKIIIRGNEAVLSWKITGCHKIIIKNLGLIAGNQSQISLILYKKINPIEITFYGVGGQEETKNIEIKTSSPSVLNSFTPNTNIINIISIPLFKRDLKNVLVNLFNYKEPKYIKLKKPKIASQNIKINFEPFIKFKHQIKF